jgi:cell division protein FtsN
MEAALRDRRLMVPAIATLLWSAAVCNGQAPTVGNGAPKPSGSVEQRWPEDQASEPASPRQDREMLPTQRETPPAEPQDQKVQPDSRKVQPVEPQAEPKPAAEPSGRKVKPKVSHKKSKNRKILAEPRPYPPVQPPATPTDLLPPLLPTCTLRGC